MIASIVEAIIAALRAIPVIDSWFKKHELDRDKDGRKDVDKEHDKNAEKGRPSDDFWDDRHL